MTAATTTQPVAVLVPARTPSVLRAVQTVDTKTALSRALREYITPFSFTEPEGRTLRFLKVYDVWAEPEDVGIFPSVAISPLGETVYEPGDLDARAEEIAPNIVIRRWANAKIQLQVQVWTNDPEERTMFAAMLENAFNPYDGTAGFFLDVPYYFNARARYTLLSSVYEDDAENAQKRWRKISFTLDAEIGAYAPIGRMPYLIPRSTAIVDS